MDWAKLTTYMQLTGAALAIPVAAGGTYSVYQNYFANDPACQKLRTSIVATMERNVPPDAKRTLLRKDVNEFSKMCGSADPDAKVLFEAALEDHKLAESSVAQPVSTAVASAAPLPADKPPDATPTFGRSSGGDTRGWVALTRGDANRAGEPNFEGFELSAKVVPPQGTVLRALHVLPVWMEPQFNTNDSSKLQGRLPGGSCVRVLSTRMAEGRGRNWGEVVPMPCPVSMRKARPAG
jgi:hypothetical protein